MERVNPSRALLAVLLLAAADPLYAQATGPSVYVAVKGGLNAESAEDGLRGSSAGFGLAVRRRLSSRWSLEAEAWIPGYIRGDSFNSAHRDVLIGVGLQRSFGSRLRPHIVFGLDIARTQDVLTTCGALRPSPTSPVPIPVLVSCDEPDVSERVTERITTTSWMPLLGAGIEAPLNERFFVVADVRIQAWIGSVIVRPAAGVGVAF